MFRKAWRAPGMIRSWSPALCRRHRLEMVFACGPVVPAFLRARPWLLWICLALLLLVGGATAQAPDFQVATKPSGDQEPITPIPPPPAADPLKLKLGESLFGDPRLSRDGQLACSSCHDLQTN